MPMHKIEPDGEALSMLARMFVIDGRIRKGDYPSQSALAKLCGVSQKTIQRDLQYLQFSIGAPLMYDSSEKGWHYEDKGFFLPAQFASKHELQALLVLGETLSQYEGTPLGESMQEAFEMVMSLVKSEDAPKLKRLSRKIHFASLPAAPIGADVWKAVLAALQHEQRLELEYRKGGRAPDVRRQFDIYGLIVRNRDWFLYGYCHLRKHCLTLALPFVTRALLMDEYFEIPDGFSLDAYVRSGFQGLQADGIPAKKITLRFTPEFAGVLASRPLTSDQTIQHEADGHVRVTFNASALFQVEREVLNWGEAVEVLEPPELRERLRVITTNLASRYAK